MQVRDFAIRWIDTDSSGNKSANQFHVSVTQRNGKNREEATENSGLKNIQEKVKELAG